MIEQDQQHPREAKDRIVIDELLQSEPNDYHLVELARLIIRYQGFPGARSLKRDLQTILDNWLLTEEKLYQKARAIHNQKKIYRDRIQSDRQQDWT
jgi:hypothetical protein